MKKNVFTLAISGLLLAFTSCSNEDNNTPINPEKLTKMVSTNYNTAANPYTPIDSTTYFMDTEERIESTERRWTNNSNITTSNYTYNNGKLAQIDAFQNGNYTSKSTFVYNNDDLVEYKIEGINTPNITKHTFTVSQDTIYSNWQRSTNSGASYNTILSSKIVLVNGDRTFYESFDPINNNKDRIITVFDANHNPISESHYTYSQSFGWTLSLTNTLTYSPLKSPFYKTLESTYSRRTLGLLQHLSSAAINYIYIRNLAPNCVASYVTDFGGSGTVNFEITNIAFNSDYAKRSVINCTSGPITTSLGFNYYF